MTVTTIIKKAPSCILREQTLVLKIGNDKPDNENLDSLLGKLETVLDRHLNEEDELSHRLFDWAVYILTVGDEETNKESFIEETLKEFSCLNDELLETRIKLQALKADLPIDIQVNEFAKEMFDWLGQAQMFIGNSSPSFIQGIDFSIFPPEYAIGMYNSLLGKVERINKLNSQNDEIAKISQEISEITKFLRVELKKQNEALRQSIEDAQNIFNERINSMEERHHLDMQFLGLRITNVEHELVRARIRQEQSNHLNEYNSRRIRDLISEQTNLKKQVEYLKSEVDNDSGGCIIS